MLQLVFASNNKNKIREIQQLVPSDVRILSLEDIGCDVDIPETAETIEGNAILKANYVTEHYGYACFADDSGLEIDALNGEPGVYSARYAGSQRNDDDNMNKVLEKLQSETNRKANFKTVIALNMNGEQHLFTGIIHGNIINEKRGTNGFGYDPIFVADGYTKTFAELSMDEKSAISHRGKAVKQLISFLKNA
ncbi:non-canonical purine NTP diphosphatase [Flavobacterium suncheonense]|uniref:dITP/XTP pyrophosphatase n=1 Tax=Flavobacterium suncheonense GH29-5 = DSM 17707 TaxID=1121899 RepID=A0A0A2M8E3_9FLAO|nr:non-canonical purine NTP diphosphatase [Flavobacterium suncheonense]KGO87678.1 deoxyribonucleotide triphosphate pyrophosphatase [Flavobacterium suncheonense GH29-5 = DSM 17707]